MAMDIEDENKEHQKTIHERSRSNKSLLGKLSMPSGNGKQKAREMMSMSVAIVLGFNIGGGNVRDRLCHGHGHGNIM